MYLLFVRIVHNMVGVRSIFNKIRPPGSKLGVLDLMVLQFEFEISVDSNELRIDPPCE